MPQPCNGTEKLKEYKTMSKKHVSIMSALALAVALALPSGAFALNYSGSQKNQATFETLEEARENGPKAVATLDGNVGRTFKSHPVLDGYPKGTTFIYRSANMYGGRAAARLNTDILVFVEKSFPNKEAAQQYLKDLGLLKIADEAIGSVILVTPADGRAFGAADQKNYYALQTAIFAQKAGDTPAGGGGMMPGGMPGGMGGRGMGGMPGGMPGGAPGAMPGGMGGRGAGGGMMAGRGMGGGAASYSDAEYFGGFGYTYVIGIDGGATYINNYIAPSLDYVSRIAGMLLINGKMETVRNIGGLVPVYLVNAPEAVVEKYKKVNNADAYVSNGGVESFFDQSLPLKRVVVAKDANPEPAKYITDAYYNLFIKAMRVPVTKPWLLNIGMPYQGYSMDQAPLSLCERNAVINGKTRDGIVVVGHQEDRFSDIKAPNGEFLQTWFEYLPEEVQKGTAPAGTVPLILANHGGGDDPRQFVEEIGILPLAGSERFAIVAPEHQNVANLLSDSLPKLVEYMLKTYPSLDASRVYVTGYSMGGAATLRAINGKPSVFAAAVPMAAAPYTGTPEQVAQFQKAHLPVMFTTSSFDLGGAFDQVNGNIATGYQQQLNLFLGYNGMKKIETFDFKTYPVNGFKADSMVRVQLNGEYDNYRWYLNDADGVPMVALAYTTNLAHALYPEYGKFAWDFFKHYSRDQKTGVIKYNPYAK
jgi:poly(3-hydroxybutyrate) depolymerase